jgi:hypothetical protein
MSSDGSLAAVLAGEHVLLIGPPGTAKSALVRCIAQLFGGSYFERLLTKFSTADPATLETDSRDPRSRPAPPYSGSSRCRAESAGSGALPDSASRRAMRHSRLVRHGYQSEQERGDPLPTTDRQGIAAGAQPAQAIEISALFEACCGGGPLSDAPLNI